MRGIATHPSQPDRSQKSVRGVAVWRLAGRLRRRSGAARAVCAAIVLGTLASLAVSRPLWLSRTSYPHSPVFDVVPALPTPLDVLVLLSFAAALLGIALGIRMKESAVYALLVAAFLVVQDQSRLQPWFVLNLLLVAAMAFSTTEEVGLDTCRLAVVATYFWSGVHKMNSSFADALFPWLASPLAVSWLTTPLDVVGAAAPFLEAGAGLALLFPRTRRPAIVGIAGMHIFLLSVLGPWALDWNAAVWPWNLSMLVVTPCLFWTWAGAPLAILRPGRSWMRRLVLAYVLAYPPLSLAGMVDTSPAFDLYSGNSVIGSIALDGEAWRRLDAERKALAVPFGDAHRIRLGDWAMAETGAPAYPEARVLRHLAGSFCGGDRSGGELALILQRPAQWMYRPGWTRVEPAETFCPPSWAASPPAGHSGASAPP